MFVIALSIVCSLSSCNNATPLKEETSAAERFLEKISIKNSFNSYSDSTIFGLSEEEYANEFLNFIIDIQNDLYKDVSNLDTIMRGYLVAKTEIEKLLYQCDSVAGSGYRRFLYITVQCAEKVLYNTQSPCIDEELYLPFAQHVVNSDYYPNDIKLIYSEQIRLASKNRIGTVAQEIAPFLELKRESEIENIEHEGDIQRLLLLYFYDPQCSSCFEYTKALLESPVVNQLLREKRLVILSLRDKSSKERLKIPEVFKDNWIDCRDSEGEIFESSEKYAIRAVPSFYLLNLADRRIILKDAPLGRIIRFFREI